MVDKNGYFIKKEDKYYESKRSDLIRLIPLGARRMLDVGCGSGNLGAIIKSERSASIEVVGIERDINAAEKANKVLDKVLIGDVEVIKLPFPQEYFDCIIYGDILEHLTDPWGILMKHKFFLKPEGYILASIPNVAHYEIMKMLKRKEWNYQQSGILDEDHLRFFTIKSIRKMFENAGLKITSVNHLLKTSKMQKKINKIFPHWFIDSITQQYLITAQKA